MYPLKCINKILMLSVEKRMRITLLGLEGWGWSTNCGSRQTWTRTIQVTRWVTATTSKLNSCCSLRSGCSRRLLNWQGSLARTQWCWRSLWFKMRPWVKSAEITGNYWVRSTRHPPSQTLATYPLKKRTSFYASIEASRTLSKVISNFRKAHLSPRLKSGMRAVSIWLSESRTQAVAPNQ